MHLRNRRTGFEYAYNSALANDPEFEVVQLEPQEASVEANDSVAPQEVVVVKKRTKKHGNALQQSNNRRAS